MTQHYRLMRAVRVQYLAVLQAIKVRFTRETLAGIALPKHARDNERVSVGSRALGGATTVAP